jgi:hypothetical protein
MTSIEPDFIVNPKTQRIVKKSETSRTYKKLLKDKVIEGTPIEPKRKPRKVYKYTIKKDDIKKDDIKEPILIEKESIESKPKIKVDAIKEEEEEDYDSDISDLIDEQEILTVLSEFMIKRKKK